MSSPSRLRGRAGRSSRCRRANSEALSTTRAPAMAPMARPSLGTRLQRQAQLPMGGSKGSPVRLHWAMGKA